MVHCSLMRIESVARTFFYMFVSVSVCSVIGFIPKKTKEVSRRMSPDSVSDCMGMDTAMIRYHSQDVCTLCFNINFVWQMIELETRGLVSKLDELD